MQVFKHGDRVQYGYGVASDANDKASGKFENYCRGYLSHAVVCWNDGSKTRVAVKHLSLVSEDQ